MARLRHVARVTIHACCFSLVVHVWTCVANDHMVGAAYDVVLDKGAEFALHAFHVEFH
jgi:hypothetical protein